MLNIVFETTGYVQCLYETKKSQQITPAIILSRHGDGGSKYLARSCPAFLAARQTLVYLGLFIKHTLIINARPSSHPSQQPRNILPTESTDDLPCLIQPLQISKINTIIYFDILF